MDGLAEIRFDNADGRYVFESIVITLPLTIAEINNMDDSTRWHYLNLAEESVKVWLKQ